MDLTISPVSDEIQWGIPDHWSAPFETLRSNRGDCEDYAIVKYVALLEGGLPEDDVKIVIVRNVLPDEDHAEVAVRVDGRWLILDNRTLTLVRDTDVTRAIPKYVLDHKGLVDSSGVAGIVRRLARHEREGIPRVDPGGRVLPVLISLNPLSTLHRRFVCARLSQPYLPGSSVPTFPQRSPRWLLTAVA